ncbi:MAG: P-II family nitrogen regulator [Mariprofundaceae bacterium]
MNQANNHKMITCLVREGATESAMSILKDRYGITAANVHYARGIGKSSPLSKRGVGEQTEKAVMTVIVPADQADEVFEFLYYETGIDQPHGGLIYVVPIRKTTEYILPKI